MTDKVVFWIGSDFIQLGLASSIQANHDCKLYAIIDITNKPKNFFIHQTFVKFQKIF